MNAVILNDTSQERHHGCSRVMENLYRQLREYGVDVSAVSHVHGDLASDSLSTRLNECDFAIINGEGTIHHNKPYAERLLKIVADSTARTKVLLNATYDSNPPHYKDYLSRFDFIFVRDTWSKAELQKIAVPSLVVPDLTFLSGNDILKQDRKDIVITCSVDREVSGHLYDIGRKIRDSRPISIFARPRSLIQFFLEFRKSIATKDLLAPRFLFKMILARRWFGRHACTLHSDFSEELTNCESLISGRYHAVCMAIKSHTPFIAVDSNTFKIKAFLHDVGVQDRCLSKADFLSTETIRPPPFSSSETERLRMYNEDAERKIYNMFRLIFQDA